MADEYNQSEVVVYDRSVVGSAVDNNPGASTSGLQAQADALDVRVTQNETDIGVLQGEVDVLQVGGVGVLVNAGSDYVISDSDWTINCTDAITVTLPTAVGRQGKVFNIKNSAGVSDVVGVDTTSAQGIDGVTSGTTLNQYECLGVQSDGSDWIILYGP